MIYFSILLLFQEPTKRKWKLGSFKEFTNEAGLRALFAEFLGTFMLVLFATGTNNTMSSLDCKLKLKHYCHLQCFSTSTFRRHVSIEAEGITCSITIVKIIQIGKNHNNCIIMY